MTISKLLNILHPLQVCILHFGDVNMEGYAYTVHNKISYERPDLLDYKINTVTDIDISDHVDILLEDLDYTVMK